MRPLHAPPPPLHPECAAMHRQGYCVCTMVACMDCDAQHPPHKPHVKLVETNPAPPTQE